MTELTHAVQFLQAAFTMLLSLAFGEAFKQLVPDGDFDMRWDRFWSLVAFVFLIFPFFHGMTRHFYNTYLIDGTVPLNKVAFFLMFDGVMFTMMSAMFFVMSRSLTPSHWKRFFIALSILLGVDTVWSCVSIWRGIDLWNFIYLNGILAFCLFIITLFFRDTDQQIPRARFSKGPPLYCALVCMITTIIDYYLMHDFFFSKR